MSKNSALRSLCVIGIILTFSILPVCAQTVLPSANAPLFVASAATRTAGVDGTTDFIGVAGTPNYSVSSNTDWATFHKSISSCIFREPLNISAILRISCSITVRRHLYRGW